MMSASFSRLRPLALCAFLAAIAPRATRAEDAVRYKFQDYQETGGRIAVKVNSAGIDKDLGPDLHLKLEGIIDAITGATPTGQPAPGGSDQVPLSQLTERRKAWAATLSRQFQRVNVAAGFANSRESDYVSNGWSVNTLTDFNQKNTTLLLGAAGSDDDVKVYYQTAREKKRTADFIAGVTQLLSPQTSLTFNFTYGRQRGYLADPYKLVQKTTEIIPGVSLPMTFAESRPGTREKVIAFTSVNHAFRELRASAEASYRFYHDTYGTDAHTLDLAWFQRVGERVIVRPGLRFYDQSAARFYHYDLDRTALAPVAGRPNRQGPYYSSDYRLSALQTFNYGIKVVWTPIDAVQLDAAYERYDMRGRDGVTPQSAYAQANIVTVGARFAW